jgi:hypothetical protein
MNERTDNSSETVTRDIAQIDGFLANAHRRGWDDFILTALDAFEPLIPLGAQVLWMAQPALGLFGGGQNVGALARLLETPEGVTALRGRLSNRDDLQG